MSVSTMSLSDKRACSDLMQWWIKQQELKAQGLDNELDAAIRKVQELNESLRKNKGKR